MGEDGLKKFSEQELERELARRRGALGDKLSFREAEVLAEQVERQRTQAGLQDYLDSSSELENSDPKPCPRCGSMSRVRGKDRIRTLRAVAGEVSYARNYHYCEHCKGGFYPLDEELGLPKHGNLSREMERRILDFGANDPFEEASHRWSVHYAEPISANLVRRVIDRQGQLLEAAAPLELQKRAMSGGAQPPEVLTVYVDGSMVSTREGWKEVKLGVIVRADQHVQGGLGRRGIVSQARYVAHVGGVEEFGERLTAALVAADFQQAKRVVWVADGAKWIWGLADKICPEADKLLDWRHLQEVSSACAQALFGEGSDSTKLWGDQVARVLWQDVIANDADPGPNVVNLAQFRQHRGKLECNIPSHVGQLLSELDACWTDDTNSSREREAINTFSGYVYQNRNRLNYNSFRERGDPTGSGTGESAHKHVIQTRMKRAGQHWDVKNADRMAQLRATYRTSGSQRFYDVIQNAA